MPNESVIILNKKKCNTHYKIGHDNVNIFGLDVHNPVFFIAIAFLLVVVALTLVFPEQITLRLSDYSKWVTKELDWFFLGSANIFVLSSLFLVFSPYGRVRIGGQSAKTEFSFASWIAMLFSAGIGVGIMFYAVLEPMNHFLTPPLGMTPSDSGSRELAMAATLYHWAFHPWAIYATVGLSLAIFCYNKGLPMMIRSVFYPIWGEKTWGWRGHIVDLTAVFATMFGLSATLGFGTSQTVGGLHHVFNTENNIKMNIAVILIISVMAIFSLIRGLNGGIKRLSQLNMILAIILMIFVLIVGSTTDLIGEIFTNTAAYISYIPELSNPVGRDDLGFMHGWTTFYWAWWISASPFVGMFIARISIGRTVREFLIAVILCPSFIFITWMTIFGSTAIDQYINTGYTGVVETITQWKPEISFFAFIEQLPFSGLTAPLGIVLVIIFFVTTLDSASMIIDTMTSGGKHETPVKQKIFWCCLYTLVSIALMLGGGLNALQNAAIIIGVGFTFIILMMIINLYLGLKSELIAIKEKEIASNEINQAVPN
ncbi:BCCT family transporter [Pseudoalteromonas arctica]|uniref:BCCT family transporter n=1 Tax=Pseudoalteromonas arctica TaxID=394751 RepID=UPI00249474DC|nr:BCCT family transporter [Pseudoalteromonas arctica]